MRLGRLDRRIQIQRPVLTTNNYGEREKSYVAFHDCFAQVVERYGDEQDKSEVDYPVLRVSFMIRDVSGVLPQMRVLHEGRHYEILEIKEISYTRNRYLELITEKRGNQDGTATSLPGAGAATYQNSDESFTQSIDGGDTYTAPDITVTDVDSTTRSVPANTNVSCEWTSLSVQNSENVERDTVASYPAGGVVSLDDVNVTDNLLFSTDYPVPSNIIISGRPVTSASYTNVGNIDSLLIKVQGCPTIFPINIVNSLGGTLDTISADPSGSFEIGTVLVNGVAKVRPANSITVRDVNGDTPTITVTESAGVLAIEVPATVDTSGIIYQRPHFSGQTTSYATGDVGWHFQQGTYNYNDGVGTAQQLDYSAADPFYTLVNDNEFGNKLRFTDASGNGATDSKALFPSSVLYVIDHLTGLGWYRIKIGINETWANAIATCNSFNDGTYSDYRMPNRGEIVSVLNGEQYFQSAQIFTRSNAIVTGVETRMWLSDTDEIVSTANAFEVNDAYEIRLVGKTASSVRATYAVRTHY